MHIDVLASQARQMLALILTRVKVLTYDKVPRAHLQLCVVHFIF